MKENNQKYWNINILTSTRICQIIRSNIHWMNAGKMIIKSYYMICILVIHQYHRLYIGYIIGYYNIHNNNKMQPMRQSYDRHWLTHTHNQNTKATNQVCKLLALICVRQFSVHRWKLRWAHPSVSNQDKDKPILGKRLG